MEMNLFADRSNEEVMNLKPSFDELAMVTPYMSVMQVQDSWDWSQTDKLIPV
jgi:hypothetical protein